MFCCGSGFHVRVERQPQQRFGDEWSLHASLLFTHWKKESGLSTNCNVHMIVILEDEAHALSPAAAASTPNNKNTISSSAQWLGMAPPTNAICLSVCRIWLSWLLWVDVLYPTFVSFVVLHRTLSNHFFFAIGTPVDWAGSAAGCQPTTDTGMDRPPRVGITACTVL